MISLTPQMRILVATEHIDLRKGIDGIAAICRHELNKDPLDGTLFVFVNRARTQLRCLVYDGQGFWICSKRLSKGKYPYWPRGEKLKRLSAEQVFLLFRGGNPCDANTLSDWHCVS